LFLSFLEEILFELQERIRGSGDVVRPTNFDIVVYGLADATGLVMIYDAGHREGRESEGREYMGKQRRGCQRRGRDIS
jgi:hypothetical protein